MIHMRLVKGVRNLADLEGTVCSSACLRCDAEKLLRGSVCDIIKACPHTQCVGAVKIEPELELGDAERVCKCDLAETKPLAL